MSKPAPCLACVFVVLAIAMAQATSKEKVLYNFCSQPSCDDGANPVADLALDATGNVWGTAKNGGQDGLGTVFELTASSGFTALGQVYSFQGGATDGANPEAGLVFDTFGNLYGTTASGGGSPACSGGCGTVFALTPGSSSDQILHSFSGSPSDGANPTDQLLFDSSGNLYGTTVNGGTFGKGTVFMLTPPAWTETILYNFRGAPDGANPVAGLIFDDLGNLWGTAESGGTHDLGTVFELTAVSGFTSLGTVQSFTGKDGANPAAALVFDTINSNYLYGTTSAGGSKKCAGGCGTVFELPLMTGVVKTLHSFTGKDGTAPVARLALQTDSSNRNYGSLYGTAITGGTISGSCGSAGCGTTFEVCPPAEVCTWKAQTLFRFSGLNGQNPAAGLLLYAPPPLEHNIVWPPPQTGKGTCSPSCVGSSEQGGSNGAGTVYELTN
jgi:uncharacterized repeat protein (TIGR03803 family)